MHNSQILALILNDLVETFFVEEIFLRRALKVGGKQNFSDAFANGSKNGARDYALILESLLNMIFQVWQRERCKQLRGMGFNARSR